LIFVEEGCAAVSRDTADYFSCSGCDSLSDNQYRIWTGDLKM
jgi:hypothetical protein